jgi:hypothetical protein
MAAECRVVLRNDERRIFSISANGRPANAQPCYIIGPGFGKLLEQEST